MLHLALPVVLLWLKPFAIKGENLKRLHTVKGRFCHHLLALVFFQTFPKFLSSVELKKYIFSRLLTALRLPFHNVSHLQLLDHKERVSQLYV